MTQQSVNPATGQLIRTYPSHSRASMIRIADEVAEAGQLWRRTTMDQRAEHMRRAATLLRERARDYGLVITSEMGKTLASAVAEVEKCAWVCDYYAEHAAAFLGEEPVKTQAAESFVTYNPLGVVLAVMPWNFPFWQVFRFAAPALMAGNTALLKHAANVPGSALAIEQVFRDAGFPEHAFRTLLIDRDLAGELIANPHVAAVTLTGSGPAGSSVASIAGKHLKKSVLELGGSDPYLILEDADIDRAAKTCVASRLINAGQSCIAAKRFIVVKQVARAFTEAFTEGMRRAIMGDPMHPDTDLGPMAREDLRQEVHNQLQQSVQKGARLLLGGTLPQGEGYWYAPSVLDRVHPGMAAFDQELFGPVAAIITARDEQQAIALANKSDFGLGAAVFTADIDRGRRIATVELQAGCCFVNDFVQSDPRMPFGGIKTSGYGRELSRQGIREFTNIKTVWVA